MLIGIDLGTTNSAVAVWRDGQAQLVANALGEFLTPSAVSVANDGTAYVGRAALERYPTHPAETVLSFKRMMGSERTVRLGGKAEYRPEELSALVLGSLLDDVAAQCGERPTEAVITVPAYFNDRQRKATRRAGELAGLKVRRLINEPTAAALAFGLRDRGDREPFLVFDLGGGTFDVSIVEMFEGIVEVRASAGDSRLGGDDFNTAMVNLMRPRLDAENALDGLDPEHRQALLTFAAERARRALSANQEAEFALAIGETAYAAQVHSDEFDRAAEPLIKRLREPVLRALRDSSIDPAELSEIVLVGGATRMPVVRRALTRMFGRFPDTSIHPDHAVALGAAVMAGLLARDTDLEEIRITDVAPFTLGINVAERDQHGTLRDGLFSPIIERNSPVPISREHSYSTVSDHQKYVKLGIYQGESRLVKDNVLLGDVEIPVPARPRGEVEVIVRFSYDSSGLLEVDVDVPETGQSRSLVIVDEGDKREALEFEARRAALAKLKFHPRDEAGNVALMARAERCYESFTGDVRQTIGGWITFFTGALERQDPREIADARERLTEMLDQIDAQSPL